MVQNVFAPILKVFFRCFFFFKNAWIYNENNNGDLEEIRLYIGEGDEIFNRKLSLKNKRPFTLSCKDVRVRYLTTKWFHIRHKKLVGPVSDIDRMLFISFWSGQADGVVSEGESFASVHIAASISLSWVAHVRVEVTIACSGAESQLCEWLASSSWTRLLPSLCLSLLICKTEKS